MNTCPRIVSRVKGQGHICCAVITDRMPVIKQFRTLKSKYGCEKWIKVDSGSCSELRELYDLYRRKMPQSLRSITECNGGDDCVLYLGIQSRF